MSTTIYCVQHDEGFTYLPRLSDARKLKREEEKHALKAGNPTEVFITANVVTDKIGKRELYCRLLNGENWCEAVEDVD